MNKTFINIVQLIAEARLTCVEINVLVVSARNYSFELGVQIRQNVTISHIIIIIIIFVY